MAKKRKSKQKRSQINESINNRKSSTQEIVGSPEVQPATIAEQSAMDTNELRNALDAVQRSETKVDETSVSGIADAIESLPTLRGALDAFVPPNVLRGWAFYQEGADLCVRIISGSSILGETRVDITRSDLMQLNNGLTGWRLETECQLSEQEFVALAETMRVIILDDSNNMIGLIPIWNKLLEKLMAENRNTPDTDKKATT